MAVTRVIAYVMHESERAFAENCLGSAEATDSFVIGDADETAIDAMRNDGLIVQPLETAGGWTGAAPETPGGGVRSFAPMAIGGGTADVGGLLATMAGVGMTFERGLAETPARPAAYSSATIRLNGSEDDVVDLASPLTYLVQVAGPMLPAQRAELAGIGAELLENYGNGYYTLRVLATRLHDLDALPFVAGRRLYRTADTVPTEQAAVASLAPPVGGDTRRMICWDARLHRAEDVAALRAWLDAKAIPVAGEGSRKIRVYLQDSDPRTAELAANPLVQKLEEFVPPTLFNDHARLLFGAGPSGGAPFPYQGSGEIIGVADTGVDQTHPDLQPQIVTAVALGRPGRTDDPKGHGTHVCGSIAGTGAASGGRLAGMAPDAKLYVQSLLDPAGGLSGLPVDLANLFDPAYQAGARIHNNSWGSETRSTYTTSADEVDEYVQAHKDMLVVIAAGNEGDASQAQTPGVVDWLSIGSPGTAKNALTVGACRTDRTNGAFGAATWTTKYPARFPDPLIGTDAVSGDPESLAAFSSRGPSDDRRIKPDLVAPGTDVLSTRSSTAPTNEYWGVDPANPSYAYLGGTSMAAPLVSGCAALVRQYYRETRQHSPSAALLRATLVNGTKWLTGRDANESNSPGVQQMVGNYDQGFGRLDMRTTLPGASDPSMTLAFVDDWADPARSFGLTGEKRRFAFTVQGGGTLRICLAYTDVSGRGLQNNLNLFLQLPSLRKLVGNAQLRSSPGPIPDVDNNVEIVRLTNPAPGNYLVQVSATNLLHPPQDFALVVFGNLAGPLAEI